MVVAGTTFDGGGLLGAEAIIVLVSVSGCGVMNSVAVAARFPGEDSNAVGIDSLPAAARSRTSAVVAGKGDWLSRALFCPQPISNNNVMSKVSFSRKSFFSFFRLYVT